MSLLLACARRFVQQDSSRDDVRAALLHDLDWPALLQKAEEHAMVPVLYWGLEQGCPGRAPLELCVRFKDHVRANLAQTAELLHVLDILEQNRIPAIPFKGPALAVWGYGNMALRAFGDLDVLIRRDHLPGAKEVLVRAGYQLASDLHWDSADACLRSKDGEVSLEHHDSGISLDLHWRLLPNYFARVLDGDQPWENVESFSLGGRTVPMLSAENLLLFLSAHGSKHRWERLGWICDFAVVLNRAEINWARILSRARQAHIERMLFLGLRLASDLLEAKLPNSVKDRINADQDVTVLASDVEDRILGSPIKPPSPFESCGINLRMMERIRDKVRFLIGTFVTPTEAEWRRLRLPPAFYFLYYPYRLARLVAKHAGPSEILKRMHSSVTG
jgi:hypothetical protein